jgi:hypothetical protein
MNYYAGQTRPVFTYDTATLPSITWIVPQLFIDVNPGAQPAETNLKTGLYLRNQNRAPSAGFSVAVSANVLGTARVVLNATISQDPEGDQLTYVWFDGSTKLSACNSLAVCSTTLTGSGTHNISLQVLDSAGLSATATQAVTVL